MEIWQREYIKMNLPELMNTTSLNSNVEAILGANNVLATVEIQELANLRRNNENMTAVKKLFDLLVTRANSFKVIGKVAFELRQSGTFLILLKGLVEHLLQQYNITLEDKTLNAILETHGNTEDALKFFMSKVNNPTMYEENWIPLPRTGIYIPRHISNRVKLNRAIFQQKCSDVFVFTGLARSDLSQLAKPNSTALSRDVILRKDKTSRFILLEYQQEWDTIRKMCCDPLHFNASNPRSVHLIQFDENSDEYILQQSTGANELISKHVPPHQRDASLYTPEEEFGSQIDKLSDRQAICICDTPGMGKTWLLENMARSSQQRFPNRLVAFVELSKFIRNGVSSTEKIELNKLNLLEHLSPSGLSSAILLELIQKSGIQLDLYLDGFDEIPGARLESAKELFRTIKTTWKNIRLLVTSRPHMRIDLEKTFGAIAYDILPFSKQNQVDYLVGFWKAAIKGIDKLKEKRLRIFARACLQKLKKSLSKEEGDLMGIPLQCFLLASVNLDNARLYCCHDDGSKPEDFISSTSMEDMYSKYFEIGINKATNIDVLTNQQKMNNDNECQNTDDQCSKRKIFKFDGKSALIAYHVWQALQLLFPELAEDYFQNENISDRDPSAQILACGLLQISQNNKDGSDGVTYLHRTFAEYMVAMFFVEVMTGRHSFREEEVQNKFVYIAVSKLLGVDFYRYYTLIDYSYLHNLIEGAVFRFKYPIIANFMNAGLHELSYDSLQKNLALKFVSFLEDGVLYEILTATICSGYTNILRFVRLILCEAFETENSFGRNAIRELLNHFHHLNLVATSKYFINDHYWTCFLYLHLAAEYSNVALVKELYCLFEKCFEGNFDDMSANISWEVHTPLHLALRRPNYSLVEYLIQRTSLSGRHLLYYTVEDTLNYNTESVRTLIDCCKLLIKNCDSLLLEFNEHGYYPVIAPNVHVELIKFLIQAGADTNVCSAERKNLVMWHAKCLNDDQFCELCEFLIDDEKAIYLFRPNLPTWGNPLPEIIGKVNAVTLAKIMQIPDVKLNDGYLILEAISKERQLEVIKMLVDNGVDIHQKDSLGRGALHLAAETGNIVVAKYLLSKECALEDQDIDGNTPLHLASDKLEMLKYLISQNANTLATNNDGNNLAHMVAAKKESNKVLHLEIIDYLISINHFNLFCNLNKRGSTPVNMLIPSRNFYHIKEYQLLLNLARADVSVTVSTVIEPRTDFLLGVKQQKNVEELKIMIKNGANAFVVNEKKQGVLHLAATQGNLEVVKFLVSQELPLEGRDENGKTPLLCSAANMAVSKYLTCQNANAFAVDALGNNIAHEFGGILSFSAANFQEREYLGLLTAKNKVGRTPLHEWVYRGVPLDPSVITEILRLTDWSLSEVDDDGRSIFHNAVSKKYGMDVLYCLFSAGLWDIDSRDKWGNTALHLASETCNWPIMEFLISINADIFAKNDCGENIAHVFIRKANYFMPKWEINYLKLISLPQGPTLLKMRDNKGQTPFHKFILHRRLSIGSELMRSFLKSGVDFNEPDREGNTVFLSAVKAGRWSTLKCLIKHGANPNSVNNDGDNALHLVVSNKIREDETNLFRFTNKLFTTALNRKKFLLSLGCDASVTNKLGQTPLQAAAKARYTEIRKLEFILTNVISKIPQSITDTC